MDFKGYLSLQLKLIWVELDWAGAKVDQQWLSSLPVVMGTGMPELRRTGMPEEQGTGMPDPCGTGMRKRTSFRLEKTSKKNP